MGYMPPRVLDTASSATFCAKSVVNALNIKGNTESFVLSTLNNPDTNVSSEIVKLTVSTRDFAESLEMPTVLVLPEIPVVTPIIDLSSYPHLADLPLVQKGKQVELLIGQDQAEALLPLEVRRGKKCEPFGVKTLFGWSVNGPAKVPDVVNRKVVCNFISTSIIDESVNRVWEVENAGLNSKDSWSQDDKNVAEHWDHHCKKIDIHYELPIPWCPNIVIVTNVVRVSSARVHCSMTAEYEITPL